METKTSRVTCDRQRQHCRDADVLAMCADSIAETREVYWLDASGEPARRGDPLQSANSTFTLIHRADAVGEQRCS